MGPARRRIDDELGHVIGVVRFLFLGAKDRRAGITEGRHCFVVDLNRVAVGELSERAPGPEYDPHE